MRSANVHEGANGQRIETRDSDARPAGLDTLAAQFNKGFSLTHYSTDARCVLRPVDRYRICKSTVVCARLALSRSMVLRNRSTLWLCQREILWHNGPRI